MPHLVMDDCVQFICNIDLFSLSTMRMGSGLNSVDVDSEHVTK